MSEPPDDLTAFRAYVRDFIAREVAPHADAWTQARAVPRALFAAAASAGLLGLKYPREHGGLARPYAYTHAYLEELGACGYMGCLLPLILQSEFATPHLALYGGADLQQRFLAPAIAGRCVVAIAMTEPEGGSDLAHLRTTATRVEGGFRVKGTKWMIGNASLADAILVVCREPEPEHHGDTAPPRLPRLTMVLVEEGFRVTRTLEKTGLHATANCELALDCFVPDANVLGRPGLALPQGIVANAYERVALAIVAVGAMRAGWQDAVRFLTARGLLDRSPWRHRLTQDYVTMEGAAHLVRSAAATLDGGRPDQTMVLMAKIAATEACQQVLQHASQAHGARGFLAEERVGRLCADARALTVGGGASEALLESLSRVVLRVSPTP